MFSALILFLKTYILKLRKLCTLNKDVGNNNKHKMSVTKIELSVFQQQLIYHKNDRNQGSRF